MFGLALCLFIFIMLRYVPPVLMLESFYTFILPQGFLVSIDVVIFLLSLNPHILCL